MLIGCGDEWKTEIIQKRILRFSKNPYDENSSKNQKFIILSSFLLNYLGKQTGYVDKLALLPSSLLIFFPCEGVDLSLFLCCFLIWLFELKAFSCDKSLNLGSVCV